MKKKYSSKLHLAVHGTIRIIKFKGNQRAVLRVFIWFLGLAAFNFQVLGQDCYQGTIGSIGLGYDYCIDNCAPFIQCEPMTISVEFANPTGTPIGGDDIEVEVWLYENGIEIIDELNPYDFQLESSIGVFDIYSSNVDIEVPPFDYTTISLSFLTDIDLWQVIEFQVRLVLKFDGQEITHTAPPCGLIVPRNMHAITSAPSTKLSDLIDEEILVDPATSQVQGQHILVNGELVIDENYWFPNGSNIKMAPGASIRIEDGHHLHVLDYSEVAGCLEMWESIVVEDGGSLTIDEATVIDGTHAIEPLDGSTVSISNSTIRNNLVGIHVPNAADPQNINFTIFNNLFDSDDLKPPLAGQIGEAGLDVNQVAAMTLVNNRFMNLANGILANRTNFTVEGGGFIDMLNSGPYGIKGYGIRASGSFGHQLSQTGLGTNPSFPTFSNCRFGVYTRGYEVLVNQNAMVDTWIGITARQNYFNTSLRENNIFASRFGLNLLLNTADNANANNNTITLDGDANIGTAIRMAEFNFISSFGWGIKDNTIELAEARYGIRMSNGHSNIITGNTINMLNPLPYEGILLDGAFDNTLFCNGIFGSSTSVNQRGISATSTANNTLSCNSVDNARWGMSFLGVNSPTFLQGNHFYDHQFALQVGEDLVGNNDLGGVIGIQEHHGNRWPQNYSGGAYGAVHYGSNAEVLDSRLIYDSSDGNDLSTNEFTPNASINWFDQDSNGDTYLCVDPCPPTPPTSEKKITEIDEKIMNGTFTIGDFPEAQLWTAKRHLYRRLHESPILMTPGSDEENFYNEETNTTVGKLEQIRESIADLYLLDPATEALLSGYQDDLREKMSELKDIDLQLANNPSAQELETLKDEKEVILSEISTVTSNKALLETDLEANLVAEATQTKSSNDNLVLTEDYEINQQTVNSVYLEMIINGQEDLNTSQNDLVAPIANQCPLSGGEAVFQARSLVNDDQAYDNATLCEPVQNRSYNTEITELSPNGIFQVYPNPAKGMLNISYETDEPLELKIFDVKGSEVFASLLEKGNTEKSIDVEILETGTYFLQITGKEKIKHTEKIEIIN